MHCFSYSFFLTQQLADGLHQRLEAGRFAHIFVRACHQAAFPVAGHGKGRQAMIGVEAKRGFAPLNLIYTTPQHAAPRQSCGAKGAIHARPGG